LLLSHYAVDLSTSLGHGSACMANSAQLSGSFTEVIYNGTHEKR
jgi:hypothetical protein